MSKLKIAPGLELDADYVGGGTFALLAKKGAGKTYTGRVLCEEFWRTKVPFVALDPMDAWWGLRSSADGEGEGIPVAIFGGEHGDAPLERTSGKLMADLVVEEGLSMVLSLKHFGSRSAERQFALDFLERLYRRNTELVHLLIDEADLFAPQKPQPGDRQLLGVTENIVRRGRNSGIGITLITQRAAVLNKDVLTQVDGLVAMRITGPQDRDAIDDWVGGHADLELAREVKGTLAGLENGECWWWVPELGVLKRVQVRASHTFDSSPTRKRGVRPREPKSFADVDMGAIEQKMADTIERAKAEDPHELQQRIRELERRLAAVPEAAPAPLEREIEIEVQVPVFGKGELDALRGGVKELHGSESVFKASLERLHLIGREFGQALERAEAVVDAVRAHRREPQQEWEAGMGRHGITPAQAAAAAAARARAETPAKGADKTSDGELTRPQQKILDALAWWQAVGLESPTRSQLAFVAGYAHPQSRGFRDPLYALRSAELVDYPEGNRVALSAAGGTLAQPPLREPSEDELQAAIFERVGQKRARMLRELIERHPNALSREELAGALGYAHAQSRGFRDPLYRLHALELVDYPSSGLVRASELCFLPYRRAA